MTTEYQEVEFIPTEWVERAAWWLASKCIAGQSRCQSNTLFGGRQTECMLPQPHSMLPQPHLLMLWSNCCGKLFNPHNPYNPKIRSSR